MTREILELPDLAPFLLLENGNYLYKVPFRGGHAVLKVYYGTRGPVAHVRKSLGSVLIAGQTSYMPQTRRRIERECLDVWSRHGFRVFGVYDDVEVRAPGLTPGGHLLLEYVDAPKLIDVFRDPRRSFDDKLRIYREFLPEWRRRHDLAIALREPRLVHENGDAKHVMLLEREHLWFDFEMIWRSRARIADHVSHEILQYLWHSLKQFPEEQRDAFIAETIEGYGDRERLSRVYAYLFRHANPLHRLGRSLHRRIRANARKPTSKYHAARRLMRGLEA